ncbi:hypothetical protein PoB_004257700 [Plakobranchus ocellatus]|uniref:Uncharacterized protein n=1 Tax=Plakobranchus ocellatus TaxID=259542 RepID=A0AAV4B9G5_9GAST|nr:hypothetical protein PoB_004257700 [Plakobranchus ocellatus]
MLLKPVDAVLVCSAASSKLCTDFVIPGPDLGRKGEGDGRGVGRGELQEFRNPSSAKDMYLWMLIMYYFTSRRIHIFTLTWQEFVLHLSRGLLTVDYDGTVSPKPVYPSISVTAQIELHNRFDGWSSRFQTPREQTSTDKNSTKAAFAEKKQLYFYGILSENPVPDLTPVFNMNASNSRPVLSLPYGASSRPAHESQTPHSGRQAAATTAVECETYNDKHLTR